MIPTRRAVARLEFIASQEMLTVTDGGVETGVHFSLPWERSGGTAFKIGD
jgi:hypothetical protein